MITLLGIGPGDADAMTVQAANTLREADLLIGASRMLASLPAHTGREMSAYRPGDILSILERERPERWMTRRISRSPPSHSTSLSSRFALHTA